MKPLVIAQKTVGIVVRMKVLESNLCWNPSLLLGSSVPLGELFYLIEPLMSLHTGAHKHTPLAGIL